MANLRTFYACQAVGIGAREPDANNEYGSLTRAVKFFHGVQSVGINSTFDIENVFELGQLEIYDSVLNIPTVEITVEKILDGYDTPYHYISNNENLAKSSKYRADVIFNIYADSGNANAGTSVQGIKCTGMYINNVTYTFPVDGNCTESVTFVGNVKELSASAYSIGTIPSSITNNEATPDDAPSGVGSPGRIVRRQDVVVTAPGSNKAQSVTLTLNLGREDVFEFGQRIPYAKLATYPIEVTAEIQSLLVDGNVDDAAFDDTTVTNPVKDQLITVVAGNLGVDLGNKCYLTSINKAGGDATGGNATITRSFTTYNFFKTSGTLTA